MTRRRRPKIESRVAERVRTLREEQGLSQGDLARLARTSRSQISDLEAARKSVTVGRLDAVARALNAPIADLLGDERGNPTGADAAEGVACLLRERGPAYVRAARDLIRTLDRVAEDALEQKS